MEQLTNEQLIAKFNPANGSNLTAEDLETLHGLTDAQLDVLADAYPNQPTRRAYLRLYDKSLAADKQLFQLSTFQNLRNVRKFSNKKNLIPWDFFQSAAKYNEQHKKAAPKASGTSPKKVVVDLSAQEAADELKNSLAKTPTAKTVDNPAKDAAKDKGVKVVKATPGKGKGANKKAETLQESGVDNESKPDDQQFSNGE